MVGGTEIGVWNGMERDGTDGPGWVVDACVRQSVRANTHVGSIEMDVMKHGRMGQMSRDGCIRMEV